MIKEWGFKTKTGTDGLTTNGVRIDIHKHVYVDLDNNIPPKRPLGSTKIPVPVPGTAPAPNKVKDWIDSQTVVIVNACPLREVNWVSSASEEWQLALQESEAQKQSAEPGQWVDTCRGTQQQTFIQISNANDDGSPARYRCTGGEFRIVGDDAHMRFYKADGGVELITLPSLFPPKKYTNCDTQMINLYHVNTLRMLGQIALDGDDPACWVTIDGVSTYVCGCN